MEDVVDRIRESLNGDYIDIADVMDAVDELVRLRDEVKELKAAACVQEQA